MGALKLWDVLWRACLCRAVQTKLPASRISCFYHFFCLAPYCKSCNLFAALLPVLVWRSCLPALWMAAQVTSRRIPVANCPSCAYLRKLVSSGITSLSSAAQYCWNRSLRPALTTAMMKSAPLNISPLNGVFTAFVLNHPFPLIIQRPERKTVWVGNTDPVCSTNPCSVSNKTPRTQTTQ